MYVIPTENPQRGADGAQERGGKGVKTERPGRRELSTLKFGINLEAVFFPRTYFLKEVRKASLNISPH